MFCKHRWEIIIEKILESPFEQMAKGGLDKFSGANPVTLPIIFKKCHICILQCTKCGKLNKTVTYNPKEKK